ncbi:MAG: transglutaminase family protein [Chloroflexi bacterium]|nr:transglutaminase family protein [Chloroflexota bacterium]
MPSNQPAAREGFKQAVSVPDPEIDLALASLWIAAEEYPQLDVVQYLGRVALLAERAKPKVRRARTPYDGIYALNEVLFGEEGLRGNKNDYYDPRNSYVSDVLDLKLGIPIALCVIYMEVARRAGLRLRGIGFPGHFVVRSGEGQAEIYVDCFDRGGLLTRRECATLTRNSLGPGADVERHLEPYSNRAILRRALTNLKSIYLKQGDFPKALAAAERIKLLEPNLWDNLADLAKIHARLGQFEAAAEMLAQYVEQAPESNDLASARETLRQLRQLARGPGTTAD